MSGASHHPAFMGNCRTISHTFYSPVYPVDEGNEDVGWVSEWTRGDFPRTNKYINYFLKKLLFLYDVLFTVFSIITRFTIARREFLTHI